MTWMRTDFDFGMPYAVYTMSARRMAAAGLRDVVSANQNDLEALARELENVVAYHRPALAGCRVVYLNFGSWGMRWNIGVTHPSLPRKVEGAEAPSYMLDPCDCCGKDIPTEAFVWRVLRQEGSGCREVVACSRECADKLLLAQAPAPPVAFDPARGNAVTLPKSEWVGRYPYDPPLAEQQMQEPSEATLTIDKDLKHTIRIEPLPNGASVGRFPIDIPLPVIPSDWEFVGKRPAAPVPDVVIDPEVRGNG